jgi:glycosyltransferase 2 family protein
VAIAMGVSAFKWWLLLPRESLRRMFELTWVGVFYSMVLPGQIAGEAVKAYRLAASHADKGRVAASVAVDKVNGVLGLLPLALVGGLLSARALPAAVWVLLLVAPCGALGALLALRSGVLSRALARAREHVLTRRARWAAISQEVERFADAWREYSGRPWLMLASVACGSLFHVLAIAIIMFLAPAFGISVPLAEWLWIFAVVSLAMLLPISIGGIGVREGAFVGTLGILGVAPTPALALSLAIFGSQLVPAVVGGILELGRVWTESRLSPATEGAASGDVRP